MFAILHALGMLVANLFKSQRRLEAENLFLRHELTIALRRAPPRLLLRGSDRALLIWMTRLWPNLLGMAQVVQPETILRWHRAGFKVFWRWKSRNRAGRPKIYRGLRDLIQRMSRENPLWGASRIHGGLLMRGFEVAQSTVSKYMVRRQNPPSQTWKTFLRNHAGAIAAIDMCVVPTLTFDHLFAFLVLGHGRRQRPRSKAAILLRDHAVQHRYREHGAFSSGMAVTRPRTVFWFGQIMNQALNAMISASLRVPKTLSVLIGGGNHLTFSAQ